MRANRDLWHGKYKSASEIFHSCCASIGEGIPLCARVGAVSGRVVYGYWVVPGGCGTWVLGTGYCHHHTHPAMPDSALGHLQDQPPRPRDGCDGTTLPGHPGCVYNMAGQLRPSSDHYRLRSDHFEGRSGIHSWSIKCVTFAVSEMTVLTLHV